MSSGICGVDTGKSSAVVLTTYVCIYMFEVCSMIHKNVLWSNNTYHILVIFLWPILPKFHTISHCEPKLTPLLSDPESNTECRASILPHFSRLAGLFKSNKQQDLFNVSMLIILRMAGYSYPGRIRLNVMPCFNSTSQPTYFNLGSAVSMPFSSISFK